MNSENITILLSNNIKLRNLFCILALLFGLISLLLSVILLVKDNTTIIVPSVISKDLNISRNNISSEYLEDMSRDIINIMLNITPSNSEYAANTILKMVHPSYYASLSSQLFNRSKDLQKRKISTVFYPITISINEKSLTANIIGDFYTYFGTKQISKERKKYQIRFNYGAFKLTIKEFMEIK